MTTGDLWVILMIALAILIYIVSLWINSWVKCSRYRSGARAKGVLFKYAFGPPPRA